ncbi:hypothetical protein P43SY_006629 [Pythium insidiosum]|uniref:Uncharacterized protein n=1 Tax=Pythium insidiosum TaxID=114742 RepID=A0AAD5LX05_PYTIN|nr:hypothetical protein P43SY_006629 [Pythium insidiosum]
MSNSDVSASTRDWPRNRRSRSMSSVIRTRYVFSTMGNMEYDDVLVALLLVVLLTELEKDAGPWREVDMAMASEVRD